MQNILRNILNKSLRVTNISKDDSNIKLLFAAQQRQILNKPLLKMHFDNWYARFKKDLASFPKRKGIIVELGSGGGYLKNLIPELITSDVYTGVADLVIDGRALPFGDNSIRGIFLASVFHHIPDVRMFLDEIQRTLCPGGIVVLIEPAKTILSQPYYTYLHHEDFNPLQSDWGYDQEHAMRDANQALSWIVFERDRDIFQNEYADLCIERIEYMDWLSYILSGGVNYRSPIPRSLAPIVVVLDRLLRPMNRWCTIVWYILIRKSE